MNTTNHPKIVLIGRTNVGKSTLFNRLIEQKKAIVSDVAGTTRDINQGICEWQGKELLFVDTGGVDLSNPNLIEKKVVEIVWQQIEDADLVALVTNVQEGLLPHDEEIAKILRKKEINFIVIANQADSPRQKNQASEFYKLHPEVFPLSAVNGSGTGELLDYLLTTLEGQNIIDEEERIQYLSITLAGIPNVGKSSLLNSLLGREEVIVSPTPHTTRESHDTFLQYNDRDIQLVDTAGLRKARKMRDFLLRLSGARTVKSIRRSDWVVMVIDATQVRWGEQERFIIDTIIKSGASMIIAANKWDLLKGKDRFKEFEERWQRQFYKLGWVPIVPISAKTGWHVNKVLDKVIELDENRHRVLPQSALDRLLKRAIQIRRPQKKKGPEAPYVHTIKQLGVAPPTFEVVIDYTDTLAESWVRFVQKMLREKFEFEGTQVRVYVRAIR